MRHPEDITQRRHIERMLARRCEQSGLDLVSPARVDWYNDLVQPDLRLPDLGRPAALALVIGNTRALWPRFLDALRRTPELLQREDPLDGYVVAEITAALRALVMTPDVISGDVRWDVRWAHDRRSPPAIQRLAHVAGLAYLAPSHLCVHPEYGPWIALRAVVIIDVDGPSGPPPPPPDPCADCEACCMPALDAALGAEDWRRWLAVRDACPVGRAHRYSDAQIAYHYTKDRGVLRDALDAEG